MTTRMKMCLPQEEKCIDSVCCIANYLIQECSFGYCFAELQFKPRRERKEEEEKRHKVQNNITLHCVRKQNAHVQTEKRETERD